ncbi:Presqualene diphosphate synthase [Azospirillaceae bacterium]
MTDASPSIARSHVIRVVRRSGSSFTLGMKSLPKLHRQAMFAIYAFGREVDDVADEGGSPDEKLQQLQDWREEVGRLYAGAPTRLTTQALLEPVRHFDLPQSEFLGLIDGMEMDAREMMRGADLKTLELYCRRVAGTVGLLSLRVFESTEDEAPNFALALAEALQITNILRDLDEDAARGRLYLPAELLTRHGISPSTAPIQVMQSSQLPAVCCDLAELARRRFLAADQALASCDRRKLRPALLMMGVYQRILDRLNATEWRPQSRKLRLSKPEKLWAAIRLGLMRPIWQPTN